MSDIWTELTLEIAAADLDLASYLLTEAGCEGIVTAERILDTFVVPEYDDPDEGEIEIRTYFPPEIPVEELDDRLNRALGGTLAYRILTRKRIGEREWADTWKQYFPLSKIGNLVLRPSWEEYQASGGEIVLTIDPGMAFGTGTHATTRLCLEGLVDISQSTVPARVLDVGTGSGILAIGAALLGSTDIIACDIDPESIRVATENAELNNVLGKICITLDPLDQLGERFDLIFANILAEENIRLADELVSRLAPGGALILSGILIEKEGLVTETFSPRFAAAPGIRHEGDWTCLIYRG